MDPRDIAGEKPDISGLNCVREKKNLITVENLIMLNFPHVSGKFLLLCLPLLAHSSTFLSFRKFWIDTLERAFHIRHIVNHSFIFFFH